jgi:hypothetical protein
MKKLIMFIFALFIGACDSPYMNPQTSKAISEQKQLEQNEAQTKLLQEQNKQLERIANALENLNSDSLILKRIGMKWNFFRGNNGSVIDIQKAQDVNIGR